jgi:hypothetical protein
MATTVRYFVDDIDSAVRFYCDRLGFQIDLPPAPGFAGLAKGDLRLLLHEPGAGGAGKAGGLQRRAAGIGFNSQLTTSRPWSSALEPRARASAATSSRGPEGIRSSWTIHRATRSRSFNRGHHEDRQTARVPEIATAPRAASSKRPSLL